MRPYIAYIIIAVLGIIILIRCLPRNKKRRKTFEIFAETGIGLFISIVILGLTNFDNFLLNSAGNLYLQYISIIFFISGIFFILSSFISLKRIGKPITGLEDTTTMIHKGIFKTIRHPLYLGLSIVTVGFLFTYQAIVLVIIGIIAITLFYIASKVEDNYNIKKFGQVYTDYIIKVPLWNFFLGIYKNRKRLD